jgi:hypothetical protein
MATGRHSFKHNDMARAIRATKAAGLTVKSVTLDNGKITLLVGDEPPPAAGEDGNPNPWDKGLPDENPKRPA